MRVGTRIGWLLVVAGCGSGMALIPAGSFTMGDADTSSSDAQPPHRVTLSAFCVDLTEVTRRRLAAVYGGPVHCARHRDGVHLVDHAGRSRVPPHQLRQREPGALLLPRARR